MEWSGKWIKPSQEMGEVCPVFIREFDGEENGGREIAKAELWVTALGVYEAVLNGSRVGQYVLAPGPPINQGFNTRYMILHSF